MRECVVKLRLEKEWFCTSFGAALTEIATYALSYADMPKQMAAMNSISACVNRTGTTCGLSTFVFICSWQSPSNLGDHGLRDGGQQRLAV
jgi:hypothetical protein